MSNTEVSHASDAKYFVQILAGMCFIGGIINLLFKSAQFISIGMIMASVLGLLLVQFSLTLRGPKVSLTFMNIVKKIFHFRNLLIMVVLTAWVFDIYINNYTKIKDNQMPSEFYNLSNAFTLILIIQFFMVVGTISSGNTLTKSMSDAHGSNDIFSKMAKLYATEASSLNGILNSINLVIVLMLYVTSMYFVTDG